jgi:hypothetical protein
MGVKRVVLTLFVTFAVFAQSIDWTKQIKNKPFVDEADSVGASKAPLSMFPVLPGVNNRVAGLGIVPEMHGPVPVGAGYMAGFAVGQPNKTKLDANTFIHGIAVDIKTNNPDPNQNAAVLGFSTSYNGADPFGGDFHAIIPADAT